MPVKSFQRTKYLCEPYAKNGPEESSLNIRPAGVIAGVFVLPSDSAYAESCASIGLMLFSSRMWLLNPRKSYYDIWEQVLHNNVLSGMGRDGKHFFYVNPLGVIPQTVSSNPTLSHVKTQRQKWFGVACCPPNLARILTSLHGYIYALEGDRLYIHSHMGSSFEKGGLYVKLSHEGDEFTLTIDGRQVDVFLRLPVNSALVGDRFEKTEDGYFSIHHAGGREQYSYSDSIKAAVQATSGSCKACHDDYRAK